MKTNWAPIRKVTVGGVVSLGLSAYLYFAPTEMKAKLPPEAASLLATTLYGLAAYFVKDPRVLGEAPIDIPGVIEMREVNSEEEA